MEAVMDFVDENTWYVIGVAVLVVALITYFVSKKQP